MAKKPKPKKQPKKKTKKKPQKKSVDTTQENPVFSVPKPYSLPPDEDGAYGYDPDD